MSLELLKRQTAAYLTMTYPAMKDPSLIVEECFDNASNAFSETFMLQFRPETWGKITLTYHIHFLETGVDITIGEIFSEVIRDSINLKRMDFLTQSLAQRRAFSQGQTPKPRVVPSLKVVKTDQPVK